MEILTIESEEIFFLLKKNKFLLSKFILSEFLEKKCEMNGRKLKIPINKTIETLVFNQFIKIYKGIFFYNHKHA
jgi:hypothetical protein